jgi:hypothetical protein
MSQLDVTARDLWDSPKSLVPYAGYDCVTPFEEQEHSSRTPAVD